MTGIRVWVRRELSVSEMTVARVEALLPLTLVGES